MTLLQNVGATRAGKVEVEFLEAVRVRLPAHRPLLEGLMCLYIAHRRYTDALQLAAILVALKPADPEAWYNLGSCYALNGRATEAIAALAKAINTGFDDIEWIQFDVELQSLKSDPRFQQLLRMARQKTGRPEPVTRQ